MTDAAISPQHAGPADDPANRLFPLDDDAGRVVGRQIPDARVLLAIRCVSCRSLFGQRDGAGAELGGCRRGHFRMNGTGIERFFSRQRLLHPTVELVAIAAACRDWEPVGEVTP